MTPVEFRKRLKAFGMNMEDFAHITGITRQTVNMWGKPRMRVRNGVRATEIVDFPRWVISLLDAWGRERMLSEWIDFSNPADIHKAPDHAA